MRYKSFTKRLLYQGEFVVCKLTEIKAGESHFFAAGMDLKNDHYAQRFIESEDKWVAKHDEEFYMESNSKMLPSGISTELLEHLNDQYPVDKL